MNVNHVRCFIYRFEYTIYSHPPKKKKIPGLLCACIICIWDKSVEAKKKEHYFFHWDLNLRQIRYDWFFRILLQWKCWKYSTKLQCKTLLPLRSAHVHGEYSLPAFECKCSWPTVAWTWSPVWTLLLKHSEEYTIASWLYRDLPWLEHDRQ